MSDGTQIWVKGSFLIKFKFPSPYHVVSKWGFVSSQLANKFSASIVVNCEKLFRKDFKSTACSHCGNTLLQIEHYLSKISPDQQFLVSSPGSVPYPKKNNYQNKSIFFKHNYLQFQHKFNWKYHGQNVHLPNIVSNAGDEISQGLKTHKTSAL